MARNNGKEYEVFVEEVYNAILRADKTINAEDVRIERNKIIKDRNDIDREFDLYWKMKIAGHEYETVIECKDYMSTINLEKIDAFIGKTGDIPGMNLIYATKTGYQSGAKIKAEKYNISLLVVRRSNEEDWEDEEGTPYIKKIVINGHLEYLPEVIKFSPQIDGRWFDKQDWDSRESVEELFSGGVLDNSKVFIYDKKSNRKESLKNYGRVLLEKEKNIEYGEHNFSEKVNNYYLVLPYKGGEISLKIVEYELICRYNKPIDTKQIIDYSEQLIGIVYDAITGNKRRIFDI